MPSLANSSKHMPLPVNLGDLKVDILSDDAFQHLTKIFPGTTAMIEGRNRSYLSFTVQEMPQQPWPLTVGGLPITINTKTQGRGTLFPILHVKRGNTSMSFCSDLNAEGTTISNDTLKTIATELIRHINDNCLSVKLVEIMYTVEESTMANCLTKYFFEQDFNWPLPSQAQARRQISPQPSGGIEDELVFNSRLFFPGGMEGVFVAKSARIELEAPVRSTEQRLDCLIYNWAYLGQVEGTNPQGPHHLYTGLYGAPVVDEEGRTVGAFRYYIAEGGWAGFSVSISSTQVVTGGDQLARVLSQVTLG
ncbi:unnamed protein product [Clonostachys rosea]|uniref:Uncharacterized protein n=1 Tax=Bionectria ochroleuca TaxID=29856 RepID=A0ABY6ULX7_BIOOC|nr:unnamed protein product [Clonostachys rosea]